MYLKKTHPSHVFPGLTICRGVPNIKRLVFRNRAYSVLHRDVWTHESCTGKWKQPINQQSQLPQKNGTFVTIPMFSRWFFSGGKRLIGQAKSESPPVKGGEKGSLGSMNIAAPCEN